MKTLNTIAGNVYVITSRNGGTVTDSTGTLSKPVEAGDQLIVTAPSDRLIIDDDEALMRQANFKKARLALRMLGAGEKLLPAGYTRLEFLESTGLQSINTEAVFFNTSKLTVRCSLPPFSAQNGWLFGGDSYRFVATRRFLVGCSLFGKNHSDSGWVCFGPAANGSNFSIAKGTGLPIALELSADGLCVDGERLKNPYSVTTDNEEHVPLCLFSSAYGNAGEVEIINLGLYRIFKFEMSGPDKRMMRPALDASGTPCMYDIVSKKPFKNVGSGDFVAGVASVAQLRSILTKLPDTGGSLTLSLPAEANTPEIADKLTAASAEKGWTLTVYEYRPAAVTTYALRRVRNMVWCRVAEDADGNYKSVNGKRFNIEHCAAIFGPLGSDPTAYGYEPFDSVEQAAAAWGLAPYEYPEAELSTIEA